MSFTIVVLPWPFSPTSATREFGSSRKLTLLRIWRGLPGYANDTFLNSNPARIGRGAGIALGFDTIFGCTEKKSIRSVMNMAWSAMIENVEKNACMLVLAPAI